MPTSGARGVWSCGGGQSAVGFSRLPLHQPVSPGARVPASSVGSGVSGLKGRVRTTGRLARRRRIVGSGVEWGRTGGIAHLEPAQYFAFLSPCQAFSLFIRLTLFVGAGLQTRAFLFLFPYSAGFHAGVFGPGPPIFASAGRIFVGVQHRWTPSATVSRCHAFFNLSEAKGRPASWVSFPPSRSPHFSLRPPLSLCSNFVCAPFPSTGPIPCFLTTRGPNSSSETGSKTSRKRPANARSGGNSLPGLAPLSNSHSR
jgi:hypothetical protein